MNIYIAYIIQIGGGEVKSHEEFSIKANSRAEAWDNAISMAFNDLFATNKMIVLVDDDTDMF